jgi:dTDP-4-dehydrorhamnose 3,5-epimerase-like enzyme
MDKPVFLQGAVAVDDRGSVRFVNDFNFSGVKRFYLVANHEQGFVRAWHGHKLESKYVLAVSGSALVGAVPVDNWESPSKNLKPERFVLSAEKPGVLFIPAGYANGFKSLTSDCRLMFFSTSSLEESKNDDFRYPARLWDIWEIEER